MNPSTTISRNEHHDEPLIRAMPNKSTTMNPVTSLYEQRKLISNMSTTMNPITAIAAGVGVLIGGSVFSFSPAKSNYSARKVRRNTRGFLT
jgi:hypothetical protein